MLFTLMNVNQPSHYTHSEGDAHIRAGMNVDLSFKVMYNAQYSAVYRFMGKAHFWITCLGF